MKKTISISIAGEIFYIEEDAYNKLDGYLQAIKRKFSKGEEKEVVDDIESAIAERFIRQSKGEDKLLSLQDIEEMIETMGTVEDIVGEEDLSDPVKKEEERQTDKNKKRFFRDTENEMIAGVCAGLGAYFEVDPTILRILFILFTFFNGIGIIVYLILWVSMPEAKTASDKLTMKGERVTIEGIKEVSEDKTPDHKEKVRSGVSKVMHKITEVFAAIINAILKVFKVLIKFFVKILGLALIVGGIFAILGIIFGFGFGVVGSSAFIPQFFADLGGFKLILLIISAFTIAVLPILFLVALGASIITKKSMVHFPGIIVGLVIWFVAIGGCLAIASTSAVKYGAIVNERMNAPIITKTYDVGQFNSIDIGNISKVNITKGDVVSVTAKGTDWGTRQISTEVKDGKLVITRDNVVKDDECPFCRFIVDNNRPMEIDIVTPDLQWISVGNSTDAKISGFAEDDLLIQAEDSSTVETSDIKIKHLTITAKGVASVVATGLGDNLTIAAKDSSSVDLMEFSAHKADVSTYDASSVKINADSEVVVMKEGVSNVSYVGNPIIKEVKIRKVESKENIPDAAQETNINYADKNSAE